MVRINASEAAVTKEPRRTTALNVALGALTFVAMPFLVTGFYRLLPSSFHSLFFWFIPAPFVILGGALIAAWIKRPAWRAPMRFVLVGGLASLVIFGVFLMWLLATFSTPTN